MDFEKKPNNNSFELTHARSRFIYSQLAAGEGGGGREIVLIFKARIAFIFIQILGHRGHMNINHQQHKQDSRINITSYTRTINMNLAKRMAKIISSTYGYVCVPTTILLFPSHPQYALHHYIFRSIFTFCVLTESQIRYLTGNVMDLKRKGGGGRLDGVTPSEYSLRFWHT